MIKTNLKYEIIDDFLSEELHADLFNSISNEGFLWTRGTKVNEGFDELWNHHFAHTFYNNFTGFTSVKYELIKSLIDKLKVGVLLRAKVNCTSYTENVLRFPLHTDLKNIKGKTCIYYLNDNNGYTYFEDGTKVFSKARRLLRFDSYHKHSGTTSSDCKARFVLNINYITRELLTYDEVQS